MVNRIKTDTAREQQHPNNSSHLFQPTRPSSLLLKNRDGIDEVIASLANAHENRRARQVNEWERMPANYVRLV